MKRLTMKYILRISVISLIAAIFITTTYNSISYAQELESKHIKNILLIGVDGNNLEKGNRSDAMIIMTIDESSKKIKLTSLGRDTYVYIKDRGKEKLTHAYAYGGPDLLLQTIKENFGIDIDRYATVSFSSFMEIIDLLGGVEVEITDNDLESLHKLTKVCYEIYGKEDKGAIQFIDKAGIFNLNGYQALAFSRMRYQDSTDARDSRQRMVIKSTLNKLQHTGLRAYIGSLDIMMSGVKTNLKPMDVILLGYKTLRIGTDNVETMEFPVYKEEVKLKEAGWVVLWDEETNIDLLNNFIYKNE